jgi:hypothetical protein
MEYFIYGMLIYFCISVIFTTFAMVVAKMNGKRVDILSIIFLLYTSPILMPIAITNVIKKIRNKDNV